MLNVHILFVVGCGTLAFTPSLVHALPGACMTAYFKLSCAQPFKAYVKILEGDTFIDDPLNYTAVDSASVNCWIGQLRVCEDYDGLWDNNVEFYFVIDQQTCASASPHLSQKQYLPRQSLSNAIDDEEYVIRWDLSADKEPSVMSMKKFTETMLKH